jgi:predicted CXXCH cytochrome family protein
MKLGIRLYLITAFLILALPMVLTIASRDADATWFLDDGSKLKDNGSWEVKDPGTCLSNPTKTTRADCNAEDFTGTYGDQASCEGTPFCMDSVSTNEADCSTAMYQWVKVRRWNVSECLGNYMYSRLYTPPTSDCLHCHNELYGTHSVGPDRNYFMTGHKNILRKVMPSSGSGSIPLGGPFYTAGLTSTPYTGIVWSSSPATSGTNSVYYIYNSWFSAIKTAQMNGTPYANLTDPTTVSTIVSTPTTSHWSCLYCHTGYYGADPDAPYPLVTETTAPSNCGSTADQPCGFEAGITCVACHNEYPSDPVLDHHTRGYASAPEFEETTAICVKCHRAEEQGPPETPGFEPLAVEELANHHGNFGGQFVNSPHARFSGDYAQLGEWDKYDSDFATMGNGCSLPQYHVIATCTDNGGTWSVGTVKHNEGCTGCHNPHVGAVDPDVLDPTSNLSQIQATCASCHTEDGDELATQVDLATINHPGGTGSPLENISTDKGKLKACVGCHMGLELTHYFRINAGGDYSTFESLCTNPDYETRTTCTNNGETWSNMSVEYGALNTYDEGGYGAVGLDVNWACGSCHYNAAKVGDKVFSKAQLSAAALGMHTGGSTTTNGDCLACHSAGTGGAPTITPGTNHHGVHSQCKQCHTGGHNSPLPDMHSNDFCLSCHTNSGSHGNHHSVSGLPRECVSCHTIPGVYVPPMTTRDEVVTGCTSCHTDIIASGTGDNHHRGHAPSDAPLTGNACQGCHSDNGGKLTTQVSTGLALPGNEFQDAGPEGTITATSKLCVVCHSEIDHGHGNFIQSGPNQNHHKGNCVTCHHAGLANCTDGAPGAGVTSPAPATIVNCTTACHTGKLSPYKHSVACLTCHEHPGAGVRPLNIQDACGQCHGGGTNMTENPPAEGVPYITEQALTSFAPNIHNVPTVSCSLVPDATVIPQGGTLGIQIGVSNVSATPLSFLLATFVTKPDASRYPSPGSWLIGPVSITLEGNQTRSGHKTYTIPSGATPGTYTYHAYVGTAGPPAAKYNECQCTFTVTTH